MSIHSNNPLVELLNNVNSFQITGFLSFPYRTGKDEEEDALNRLLHNTIELTDKKIDGLAEDEFRTKLEDLKEKTIFYLRSKISLDTPISKAVNIYQEAIENIDYTLEDLKRTRRDPCIIFSNEKDEWQTDRKYIKPIEFDEYKKEYDFLSTIILDRLKRKLENEIKYLELSNTIKDFIVPERLAILEKEQSKVFEKKEPKYLISNLEITKLYKFGLSEFLIALLKMSLSNALM